MKQLPQRKNLRLREYDYSQPGYYFVTICTHNKQKILSNIVGDGFHATPVTALTGIGNEIAKAVDFINNQYPYVKVDKYVIMPNHIHMIIVLQQMSLEGCENIEAGRRGNLPLHRIVGQFKSYINKKYNDMQGTKNLIL